MITYQLTKEELAKLQEKIDKKPYNVYLKKIKEKIKFERPNISDVWFKEVVSWYW